MRSKTLKNIIIIMGCSVMAKLLAYVWEAVLAAYLGASDQSDAFYMTTSIFNILYPILDIGIWKVFLPIYKKKMVNDPDSTDVFADKTVTLFLCLSAALVVILFVFAKPIVAVIATGFSPEKKALAEQYLRISAPGYLLLTTASVIGATLQCHDRFFGSQIRELGTHIFKIVYVFICYRFLGIYAAVSAIIVGSLGRIIVQLPFVNWGWRFRPDFRFRDHDAMTMIKGLPSVAVTAAISHINGLIDKMVASGAESGAVSCLNYGQKLFHVFSGMISTAVMTAVYPTMIQHIAKNEDQKLRSLTTNTINALVLLIVPISAFCIVFSPLVVKAAFERGAFTAEATAQTAGIFTAYAVGMLFMAISSIVTSVFYGYGDTKITLIISIINICLNIALDLLFYHFVGVVGLAYATSISAAICLIIRLVYLKKYIKLGYRSMAVEAAKMLPIAIASTLAAYFVFTKLLSLNVFVTLILSVIMIAGLYLALAKLLRVKTLDFVLRLAKNFFKRKSGEPAQQ